MNTPLQAVTNATHRDLSTPPHVRDGCRRIEAPGVSSYVECYHKVSDADFAMPVHSRHWLIVQESRGPSYFLTQAGNTEVNLSSTMHDDGLVYIPPFTKTHWQFSRMHESALHVLIPDSLIMEVLDHYDVGSVHCFLSELTPVLGDRTSSICRLARDFLRLMRERQNISRAASDTFILDLAELFVAYQVQHVMDARKRGLGKVVALNSNTCARIHEYIEDNLESDISVDELAGLANMSNFHFSRCYKAATGLSPYRYLSRVRVAKARALLCRKHANLSEIAVTCGFSDQPHLTRVFKKICGLTPGAFRQGMMN
ncbi:helix-turn-helix domain-containing protein [Oceaniferula spumae]|uniref:helix-turn-helix domain-containing protein n=1 Tax=Oceaniferula spumae TaxID=2979115 RepID=UPI003F4E5E0A